MLKRELENLYNEGIMQLDYKSCEMIATDIVNYIQHKYAGRKIAVTVSEDDENGSTVSTF